MRLFLTLALVSVILVTVSESAKRCYSGSKDRYESRQCDTGTSGNFVCQKFTCEGGKSPFVLRTCANKNTGCLAGPAILDSNFTVRACAPEGSRCESSSTVCADQDGVGYCSICEDDNCNSADFGKLSMGMVLMVLARIF
ncbi:hypothetical protein B9Z55_021739 [Caenorhabditis nigoni]|uniref:DUF281 domain-containing protein n=1 Tax=Caenorhabditis nigoni TaxID=1611254 RepID=A0A2G5TTE9_9PELO|nr:hypothetical protein B9Z55_021739 [Caenorhabditis nigoni]